MAHDERFQCRIQSSTSRIYKQRKILCHSTSSNQSLSLAPNDLSTIHPVYRSHMHASARYYGAGTEKSRTFFPFASATARVGMQEDLSLYVLIEDYEPVAFSGAQRVATRNSPSRLRNRARRPADSLSLPPPHQPPMPDHKRLCIGPISCRSCSRRKNEQATASP